MWPQLTESGCRSVTVRPLCLLHHQLQSHAILKRKDLYPVQKITSEGDLPCCHFGLQKKVKILSQHTREGLIPANTHINRKSLSCQKVVFLLTMGFKDVSSYRLKQLLRNLTISNSLGIELAFMACPNLHGKHTNTNKYVPA